MITVENAQGNGVLFFLNRLSLFCHSALTILFIVTLLYCALILVGLTAPVSPPIWIWLIACGIGIVELLAAVISNRTLDKTGLSKAMPPSPKEKYLVKRKFSWMYAPDKLEHWLEQMESHGYSLHSIGKRGRSFYFATGVQQKQKYCIDYRLAADCMYIAGRIQAGWKPLFSTFGSFGKWTIWARENIPGQDLEPDCDNNLHQAKFAQRAAIAYSGVLVATMALYSAGLMVAMGNTYAIDMLNTAVALTLFGLIVLAIAQCTVRTWLYYLRVKQAGPCRCKNPGTE